MTDDKDHKPASEQVLLTMPDPPYIIRRARPEDLPAIKTLIRSENLDPTGIRWQDFLVAEQATEVIGCGRIKHLPGARELGSLVVKADRRRQGIASSLMTALVAQETGTLYLICPSELAGFYGRFAFAPVSFGQLPWALKVKRAVSCLALLPPVRVRFIAMVRSEQASRGRWEAIG